MKVFSFFFCHMSVYMIKDVHNFCVIKIFFSTLLISFQNFVLDVYTHPGCTNILPYYFVSTSCLIIIPFSSISLVYLHLLLYMVWSRGLDFSYSLCTRLITSNTIYIKNQAFLYCCVVLPLLYIRLP